MPQFALVVQCWLVLSRMAVSADSAVPPAIPTQSTPANTAAASKPTATTTDNQETWQQREERLQRDRKLHEQLEQLRTELNRPTAWQLQNPSGLQNRTPTDSPRGYIAPNTYFGSDQRAWTNQSAPIAMPQMPANYFSVPPVNFSNVLLAPNTYWGPANQSWSNVRTTTAIPSGLGGWNLP